MNKVKNRVGETTVTKEGYTIEIVSYTNAHNITVSFIETGFKIDTTYTQFCRRNIRYPYHRTVEEVGYLGVGQFSSTCNKSRTKCYDTWRNMLKRCYNEEYQQKRPTYKGCEVCEGWHNFQNFAKWYEDNYYEVEGEQMHLDKDWLKKGNKVYSPDTCIFVPRKINSLITTRFHDRGETPLGVTFEKETNSYVAMCNNCFEVKQKKLGRYQSALEAFQAYKEYKERHVKEVAEYYKPYIPIKLYEAMLKYEVNIND